jgi:hypothetical protein
MAVFTACALPGRFRAVMTVAASVLPQVSCHRIRIVAVHGDADPVDPHLGKPGPPGYLATRRRCRTAGRSARTAGSGQGATDLVGAGEWGRDSARPAHPSPPPFTTIAWRLGHLSEMLTMRADHTIGSHSRTRDDYRFSGDAVEALTAFDTGAEAWRAG